MGGSPSKKENFQECILTQENIDKVYNNFCEFSKLKDGKSGTYISLRGMQKLTKPNKELGRKIHEFLAQQSVSQTLDFEVFLYFGKYESMIIMLQNNKKVEFFLQGTTFIRQDKKYREYSVLEMFGLLSFYSNLTKNKQTDKEYINRLHITFRSGLEFFKELHGIIAAINGIYKVERDELIAKRMNSLIFGDKYEMTFQEFISSVKQKYTNVEAIIQTFFRRTFYINKPYKVSDEKNKEQSNPPPKTSDLLNHNALSNLQLCVNQFSEFPHRENVYNATHDKFQFALLTQAISTFNNCNQLLLISHQVSKQPVQNEEGDQYLSKSRSVMQSNTERQVLGVFLPRYKSQSESFVQLQPTFQLYPNSSGKENFFNTDTAVIVVFFGEGEQDILVIANEIQTQSYIKSSKPELAQNVDQLQQLKIDYIELWALSNEPIDLSNYNIPPQKVNTEVVTPQPVTTYTTTTNYGQTSSQQVVVERNVTREYYVTTNSQYNSQVPIKDVK